MRTDQSRLRRPGIAAAVAVLAAAGVVGGVSVAGATAERARSTRSRTALEPCFSASADGTVREGGREPEVTHPARATPSCGMLSSGVHNASSKGSTPAERGVGHAQVTGRRPVGRSTVDVRRRPACTTSSATCTRRRWTGTIIVEGDPVETATPTATATPTGRRTTPTRTATATATFTATARPGATATPDSHLNTPAPGKAARTDTTAPTPARASRPRRSRRAPS